MVFMIIVLQYSWKPLGQMSSHIHFDYFPNVYRNHSPSVFMHVRGSKTKFVFSIMRFYSLFIFFHFLEQRQNTHNSKLLANILPYIFSPKAISVYLRLGFMLQLLW